MNYLTGIAMRHLWARPRQSLVSIIGIILGTAFFLAISGLMQGSEKDFINRLVNNTPHITISDEFRSARAQPVSRAFPDAAVELRHVKPLTETRGIRGFEQKLDMIRAIPNLRASSVLSGQGIASFAGHDETVTLNGMIPSEMTDVTTIGNYMLKGNVADLIADPDGVIIGAELARNLSLSLGDTFTIVSSNGTTRAFRILGIFRTGRGNYDRNQVFMDLKRVQAMTGRINRVNSILIKMDDPNQARVTATKIERAIGYKSMSWQEQSEDIMSTLAIRNMIMYTVVSAVLIVAAFGIYNVISTVVMEKQKDIAILKSMGFAARDIRIIFVTQGIVLGVAGCAMGIPLGCGFMLGLMQIKMKPPGATEMIHMPLSWDWPQFAIAIAFAMVASTLAAWLPARKAASVDPIVILRGQM